MGEVILVHYGLNLALHYILIEKMTYKIKIEGKQVAKTKDYNNAIRLQNSLYRAGHIGITIN